jgi:hypothetical protein
MLNSLAFLTNGPQGCASTTFSNLSKASKAPLPLKAVSQRQKFIIKLY